MRFQHAPRHGLATAFDPIALGVLFARQVTQPLADAMVLKQMCNHFILPRRTCAIHPATQNIHRAPDRHSERKRTPDQFARRVRSAFRVSVVTVLTDQSKRPMTRFVRILLIIAERAGSLGKLHDLRAAGPKAARSKCTESMALPADRRLCCELSNRRGEPDESAQG